MKKILQNEETINRPSNTEKNNISGSYDLDKIVNQLLIRRIVFRNAYFVYNVNSNSFELHGSHLFNKKSANYRTIYIHDDIRKLAFQNKFVAYIGWIDEKLNFLKTKMSISVKMGTKFDYNKEDYNWYCKKHVLPLNILKIIDIDITIDNK